MYDLLQDDKAGNDDDINVEADDVTILGDKEDNKDDGDGRLEITNHAYFRLNWLTFIVLFRTAVGSKFVGIVMSIVRYLDLDRLSCAVLALGHIMCFLKMW